MDVQQSFFAGLQEQQVEREALVRGALHNAGLPARDVAGLWLICRELIDADGSLFPPSVADLVERLGISKATVDRRLAVLTELGIVAAVLDAGKSAAEPKRRSIHWDETAKLARRRAPAETGSTGGTGGGYPSPRPSPTRGEGAEPDTDPQRSLPHHEATAASLAHREATTRPVEATSGDRGSVCFSLDSPPSPKGSPPNDSNRGGGPGGGGEQKIWKQAERRLRGLGVFAAPAAIGGARAGGASALEVLAVVEWARARPEAWTPTQIYFRTAATEAGDDPAAGWPEPSEKFRKRQTSQRVEAKAAADTNDFRRRQSDAQREQAEFDEAWSQHGAAIDALSDAQQVQLVVERLGEAMGQQVRRMPREGPMRRQCLLGVWLKRTEAVGA